MRMLLAEDDPGPPAVLSDQVAARGDAVDGRATWAAARKAAGAVF